MPDDTATNTLSYNISGTIDKDTIISITKNGVTYRFYPNGTDNLITYSGSNICIKGTYQASSPNTVYFDATLSKLSYAGDVADNSLPLKDAGISYHAWNTETDFTDGDLTKLEDFSDGTHTWSDVYQAQLDKKYSNILFYSSTDGNIPSTPTANKTDDLTIPDGLTNPCFYADTSDDSIYKPTNRSGYWGELYTVRNAEGKTKDGGSPLTTYEKNLVGFERLHLKPGETKEVRFMLDRKDMELLNAKNDWVVEPGEFRVMAGASSEDIRLSDKFAVVEYGMNGVWSETGNSKGDAISASTEMQDVGMTLDNDLKTCWQGNKGYYITFALENGAKIDGLSIAWKKENTGEADFEIQLSGGGGQFLTVYSGSVSKFNEWMSYTFKGTTASDLRILLNSDGLGVAEVKINQLKKE